VRHLSEKTRNRVDLEIEHQSIILTVLFKFNRVERQPFKLDFLLKIVQSLNDFDYRSFLFRLSSVCIEIVWQYFLGKRADLLGEDQEIFLSFAVEEEFAKF
jgi:hypothetical protein